ncbi:hypothetical protein [Carboxydocella sp. ULO1]|uniref:hypothetical protein n=2 Tax=Carboxydocella sp. ULO1 TaxID=1926599 RepID=UPI0009AE0AAA|nr:hypothetical protein [Carboxydocella sp. ULO1]GAW28957.1 hypothetical protein ULO1_15270 [Carboxydocella sp. ULO1]
MSEQLLKEILSEIKAIKTDLTEFKTETGSQINHLAERINRIEQNMATKTDLESILADQQKDVLAILRVVKSQLEEQSRTSNDRLDRISMDINYLVRKTAEHENDILALKRAK